MVTDYEMLSHLPFYWIECFIAKINYVMSANLQLHSSDFF